jgi:hypothetical protein
MDEHDWLAQRFEANRTHLRAVAYRLLGSLSEADDAVQETWLHLSRADPSGVDNLGRWLTTVVARVCLDMLRSRTARREELLGVHLPDPIIRHQDALDPEQEALLPSWGAPRPPPASLPAVPAAGSGPRPRFPMRISPTSEKWSMPSLRPRATVTSMRSLRCWTQTWWSAPTGVGYLRAPPGWSGGRGPWPSRRWPSRGVPPVRGRRW